MFILALILHVLVCLVIVGPRAAPGRQGGGHRLRLRRDRQPGRLRLHGDAHRPRQGHDGGRRRLHGHLVRARHEGATRAHDHAGPAPAAPATRRPAPGAAAPATRARLRPPAEVAGGHARRRCGRPGAPLAGSLRPARRGLQRRGRGRADDGRRGEPPAYGDTFVHAYIGDIAGLIPNITSDAASHEVGDRIYDGLITHDRELK